MSTRPNGNRGALPMVDIFELAFCRQRPIFPSMSQRKVTELRTRVIRNSVVS
jgi:hypothetical protein